MTGGEKKIGCQVKRSGLTSEGNVEVQGEGKCQRFRAEPGVLMAGTRLYAAESPGAEGNWAKNRRACWSSGQVVTKGEGQ